MPTMTKLRADKRIRCTLKSTRRHLLSLIIVLSITLNIDNRRYNAIFRLNLSIKLSTYPRYFLPFSNFQANAITFEALGLSSEGANNKTFNSSRISAYVPRSMATERESQPFAPLDRTFGRIQRQKARLSILTASD